MLVVGKRSVDMAGRFAVLGGVGDFPIVHAASYWGPAYNGCPENEWM